MPILLGIRTSRSILWLWTEPVSLWTDFAQKISSMMCIRFKNFHVGEILLYFILLHTQNKSEWQDELL